MINDLDADLVAHRRRPGRRLGRGAGRGRGAAARPAQPATARTSSPATTSTTPGTRSGSTRSPGWAAGRCATSGVELPVGRRPGRRQRRRRGARSATARTSTGRSAAATRPGPSFCSRTSRSRRAEAARARRRPAAVRAHPRRPDGAVQPARPGGQQPVVSGLGEVDGMPVYVTNGAGFWGPPVRVGAPPEVSLIELRAAVRPLPSVAHVPAVPGRVGCGKMRRVRPAQSRPTRPWVADLHIHSQVLPRLQPRPRPGEPGLVGAAQGHRAARHRRLHPSRLVRPPAREPAPGRAGPVPAGAEAGRREIARRLPAARAARRSGSCSSVEISTIYKRDDRTRKVHHLIYLPDFEAVARFNARLGRGPGGLAATWAPTAGRSSAWTRATCWRSRWRPARTGSWCRRTSGRRGSPRSARSRASTPSPTATPTWPATSARSRPACSSDPEMNWRVASLDRYQLVSNSDAHSPQALAREATVLTTELDYFAVKRALETGDGLHGTLEFFPEEGKYHADGHRACGVCWEPARTREAGGRCPECGKPLTVGVLHRVEELADRPVGWRPAAGRRSTHLIQLHQVLGEIQGVGARSKSVEGRIASLVAVARAPNWTSSCAVPVDEIGAGRRRAAGRGDRRLRRGRGAALARVRRRVRRDPPLRAGRAATRRAPPTPSSTTLPDAPHSAEARTGPDRPRRGCRSAAPEPRAEGRPAAAADGPASRRRIEPLEPMLAGMEEVGTGLLDRLDAMQRVAASAPGGPLLVVAGPGHRQDPHADAPHRLPVRRTERAARTSAWPSRSPGGRPRRCGPGSVACSVTGPRRSRSATFHALGLRILRENAGGRRAGRRASPSPTTPQRAAARGRGRRRPTRGVREAAARAEPGRPRRAGRRCRWRLLRDDAAAGRASTGPAGGGSSSTSTRTSTRPSTSCCACSCRPTATCARSATRTRRSTRSAAPTWGTSCGSPPTSPMPGWSG